MDKKNLLEEFRAEINRECVTRGVKPPEKHGIREKELFSRWLKGRALLDKMKKDESGRIS